MKVLPCFIAKLLHPKSRMTILERKTPVLFESKISMNDLSAHYRNLFEAQQIKGKIAIEGVTTRLQNAADELKHVHEILSE